MVQQGEGEEEKSGGTHFLQQEYGILIILTQFKNNKTYADE